MIKWFYFNVCYMGKGTFYTKMQRKCHLSRLQSCFFIIIKHIYSPISGILMKKYKIYPSHHWPPFVSGQMSRYMESHLFRSTVVTLKTTPLSQRIMKRRWENGQLPILSPSLPACREHNTGNWAWWELYHLITTARNWHWYGIATCQYHIKACTEIIIGHSHQRIH